MLIINQLIYINLYFLFVSNMTLLFVISKSATMKGFDDWNQEVNNSTVLSFVLIIVLILCYVQKKLSVGNSLESTQTCDSVFVYTKYFNCFFNIETCIK